MLVSAIVICLYPQYSYNCAGTFIILIFTIKSFSVGIRCNRKRCGRKRITFEIMCVSELENQLQETRDQLNEKRDELKETDSRIPQLSKLSSMFQGVYL